MARQTAQRDKCLQEKQLLEHLLNDIRDDRKGRWSRDNPQGANVHLFVSDEHPTAENAQSLKLAEPWECDSYRPHTFAFNKVSFPFDSGNVVKVYGYFIRKNPTGEVMFLERFKNAPFDLSRYGGSVELDLSKLTWN